MGSWAELLDVFLEPARERGERGADGELRVFVPFALGGFVNAFGLVVAGRRDRANIVGVVHHELSPRQTEVDSDVEGRAVLVAAVAVLDEHAAAHDADEETLELRRFGLDQALQRGRRLDVAIGNLRLNGHRHPFALCGTSTRFVALARRVAG
jgi:hypothetical protein